MSIDAEREDGSYNRVHRNHTRIQLYAGNTRGFAEDSRIIRETNRLGFARVREPVREFAKRVREHFVAFCSTPGQEPLVRARVAVEESFVPETDSLARS